MLACCGFLAAATGARGQTVTRRLTTIDALRQYPGYYHLQNVILRGEFAESLGRVTLRSETGEIRVQFPEGVRAASGDVEIRGQLVDIGRLEVGDARVAALGDVIDKDRWPRPGEELYVSVAGVVPADAAVEASVRAVALEPWKFEGKPVTLTGNFRGRNLYGDQPGAPGLGKFDFVLRGTEGAVWVTGQQPRGRGFDLDVNRRIDTNQWVEVTGTLSRQRGLVVLDATRVQLAKAPSLVAEPEEAPAPAAPPPPADVIFSTPSDGETDVRAAGPLRVQFSRGLNPATVQAGFRVSYVGADPDAPAIVFRATYDPGNRAVEITFPAPLDRFRTVRLETTDTLKALDGGVVTPWAIAFSIAN